MRLLPQDGQSRITLGEPGSGWWVCGTAHLHPEPPSGDWDKPGGGFDRVLGAGQAPEAADLMQGHLVLPTSRCVPRRSGLPVQRGWVERTRTRKRIAETEARGLRRGARQPMR